MSNYYDIDDILCEEQQVDIQVSYDIYRGGEFDQECDHTSPGINDIQAGHKIRVPFWFGKAMLKLGGTVNPSKINIPEMYFQSFMNLLNSDAVLIVSLRDYSNYYYEFANKMIQILPQDVRDENFEGTENLTRNLKKCIIERAKNIFLMSQKSNIDPPYLIRNQIISCGTVSESIDFQPRNIAEDYRRWKDESINKRKRVFMLKKLKQ